MSIRWSIHLGITIRPTEALKVEPPDCEASLAQRIAPRAAVKPVRDRKRRGKRRAMNVKHDPPLGCAAIRHPVQAAQEQPQPVARPGNQMMLLARVKPRDIARVFGQSS